MAKIKTISPLWQTRRTWHCSPPAASLARLAGFSSSGKCGSWFAQNMVRFVNCSRQNWCDCDAECWWEKQLPGIPSGMWKHCWGGGTWNRRHTSRTPDSEGWNAIGLNFMIFHILLLAIPEYFWSCQNLWSAHQTEASQLWRRREARIWRYTSPPCVLQWAISCWVLIRQKRS